MDEKIINCVRDLKLAMREKRRALVLLLITLMLSGCDIGDQLGNIGSNIGEMVSGLLK